MNSASEAEDKRHIRQLAFLSTVTAVALVEIFLNIYVQVKANEPDGKEFLDLYNQNMQDRKSLDFKLRNWPEKFFNAPLDFSSGAGAEFNALKNRRNSLMHFKSSYQTLEFDGIQINGLADTTAYDDLSAADAEWAMNTSIAFIAYFFDSIGIERDQIPHMLHGWTGRIPI